MAYENMTKDELIRRLESRRKSNNGGVLKRVMPVDKGGIKVMTTAAEVTLLGPLVDKAGGRQSPGEQILKGDIGQGLKSYEARIKHRDLPYRKTAVLTLALFLAKKAGLHQVGPFANR